MEYLRSNNVSLIQNRFIIVGKCVPKFIRRYNLPENLQMMVLAVDTRNWLEGTLMYGNVKLYKIYRKNSTAWKTFPIKSIQTDTLLKTETNTKDNQYGSLENIPIHSNIYLVSCISFRPTFRNGNEYGIYNNHE